MVFEMAIFVFNKTLNKTCTLCIIYRSIKSFKIPFSWQLRWNSLIWSMDYIRTSINSELQEIVLQHCTILFVFYVFPIIFSY